MNKREIKPIGYEAAATILKEALDNGEFDLFLPEGTSEKDYDRLQDFIEGLVDALIRRAARQHGKK